MGQVRSGRVHVFTFDFYGIGDSVLEAVVGRVRCMFLPLTSALLAMAFSRQSWVRSGPCFYL
jgi:hypothetical protein